MYISPGFDSPTPGKLGVVLLTCDPGTSEVIAGRPERGAIVEMEFFKKRKKVSYLLKLLTENLEKFC